MQGQMAWQKFIHINHKLNWNDDFKDFLYFIFVLNVNSQQAETSHWSQSITDCGKSSTAIQVMFWPQEPEQLTGPNMEPTNQIKWCMTPSHKVHTGASLHLPQEQQQHNTQA